MISFYNIHTHKLSDINNACAIYNAYPLDFGIVVDPSFSACCFSCGIHPWYMADVELQLNALSEIASDNKIVAIGEAGYDSLRGVDMDVQRSVFEAQVGLSETLAKPLIIHCVKAWDHLITSYKRLKPKQAWIIHGYRGNPEQMNQLLNLGFLFSIGDKFNPDTVRKIPLDAIFCETDTSDGDIRTVYLKMSEAKDISVEVLANSIEINVATVFPLLRP